MVFKVAILLTEAYATSGKGTSSYTASTWLALFRLISDLVDCLALVAYVLVLFRDKSDYSVFLGVSTITAPLS